MNLDRRWRVALGATSLLLLLSAVAFAGLLIFGDGGARATRLCGANEAKCLLETYPANTPIEGANAGNITLEAAGSSVVCAESQIDGQTTNEGGGAGILVLAEIENWKFSGCTLGVTVCAVKALESPFVASASWTGGTDGKLQMTGIIGHPNAPELDVLCVFEPTLSTEIDCVFAANSVDFGIVHGGGKGEGPPKLTLNKQGFTPIRGENCPCACNQMAMSGAWELAQPTPLYVTKE